MFWLTGVPMVLNTSFNEKWARWFDSQKKLSDGFLRTELDLLILGNHTVRRTAPSAQ